MKAFTSYIIEKLKLTKHIKSYTTIYELEQQKTIHCLIIRKKYKPVYFRGGVNMHKDDNGTVEMCCAGPYMKLSGNLNICAICDFYREKSYDKNSIIAASRKYFGVILAAADKAYFDLIPQEIYDKLLELQENTKDEKEFAVKSKKILDNCLT